MKVTVKVQPTGLLNGQPWPGVGEDVDLPDVVAEGMTKSGHVEAVKAKPAKKSAAKSDDKVEKRPASKSGTETRKKS